MMFEDNSGVVVFELVVPADVAEDFGKSRYVVSVDLATSKTWFELSDGTVFDSESTLMEQAIKGTISDADFDRMAEGFMVLEFVRVALGRLHD